jgi:hypothetical protein
LRFILDSDALIKLNRAGALGYVVDCFDCVVPDAVFDEVVLQGTKRGYSDAAEIRDLLSASATIETTSGEGHLIPGLGKGELAVAELIDRTPGAIVVSDDGQFLNHIERKGALSVTPAALLVTLAEAGHLSAAEALATLGRMRPAIRVDVYEVSRIKLEEIGGHGKN